MDYGRRVLLMTAEATEDVAGGEPDVNPRGGIFGPHGGGGGLFDGTNALNGADGLGMGQAGLGWYFAAETPQLTRGGYNPSEGAHGVGALPESCKTSAAFNACDNEKFEAAQTICYGIRDRQGGSYSPYADFDDCASKNHAQMLKDCEQYCPSRGGQTYTQGDSCTAVTTIKFVQSSIGAKSDGVWGKNSQTALTSSGHAYKDIAVGCAGAVPGVGGGGGYVPPVKKDDKLPVVLAKTGGNMNIVWIGVGLAALGAGAFLLAKKKKRA